MVNQLVKQTCEITLEHPQFRNDFIQLTKNELSPDYNNPLTPKQISKLLETASLFALDSEKKFQKLAFKISVYLLNQHQKQFDSLPVAVEIILSRLGNIPTIRSMVDNKHGKDYFDFFSIEETSEFRTISTYVQFPEILVKQITNKQKITEDIFLTFTDFQATIYSLLRSKKNVTFSAPTSTGKSYVIHSYIAENILKSDKFCAVYLVPTKALIAEVKEKVERKIIEFGKRHNEFGVFMSANFVNLDELGKYSKKVFVLTQERLQDTMANNPLLDVDLIVVDEAQKISDESRGVIIEDSVKDLIRLNPDVQIVVISPNTKNPEEFKNVFEIEGDLHPEKTIDSPVTQNIFYVDFGKKTVNISLDSWDLDLETTDKLLKKVEVKRIKDLPGSMTGRKAWVVNNLLPEKEPTLVYCDKPYDCRRVARSIAEGKKRNDKSKNLKDAISFFKESVHEEYYLVDALNNKIGYHYGKMPQFVRFYIKNLFENKDIDLLCCTSTLLEGVNLPAKNIILYNPKAGKPMDRLSILNLAGRAGRLLKDYYGKIYCINIMDWENGEDLFSDELEKIESSVEKTLANNVAELIAYLEDASYTPDDGKLSQGIKTLANSLLMKQLKDPSSSFVYRLRRRCKTISDEELDTIKQLLVQETEKLQLDKRIILKNRSIDPRFQDELYSHLRKNFIPPPFPAADDFYDQLKQIFKMLSRHIFRDKEDNRSFEYFTLLAYRWINEKSYKSLLESNIQYNLKRGKKGRKSWKSFVNHMIVELDVGIEQKIKYEHTNALKCYLDISEKIREEIQDESPYCKELPIFLEAGTCNRNTLFLLELGLSRNVAIKVANLMELASIQTSLDCINWIFENQIKIRNHLSAILYHEIENALNKYDLTLKANS